MDNLNNCYNNKDNNIIYEKNEFINPDHELNWKYSLQNSYHFKQDIERVWIFLKNFELLSMLSNQGNSTCVYIKGKDTWKLGNEFKGLTFGIFPYVARVNMVLDLPEMKKIEWLFNNRKNEYYIVAIELFKVTEDNSTVIIEEFKFENELLKEKTIKFDYKVVDKKLFENIEQLLEKEPINLLKYESTIINGKMEDVWDIITDYNKIAAIAPNNNYLPNINLRNLTIGEKKEASIFYNNAIRTFDVILKYKEEKPGWNKWLIVIEISGGTPEKIPKHIGFFQITKISNNKCQLTLVTKYNEHISNEEFNEISNKKKYLLLSIKDYFDNFYTPEN